jgi:hypothetical protein
MTIIMTFPLILEVGESIIGGMGDGVYFVWLIRWYQQVIFEGKGYPFFNPWMNYPQGWNLSTTDTTLASALPGVPFSLILGPIAGFNFAMAITFVLSGMSMTIWVRHLTKSDGAGLIAGTIYAFLPYRMAHFVAGHLNLSGTAWFPLYFMGLFEIFNSQKQWKWWPILLSGIALGLIGFTSMYYLYMTLIISAIFGLAYLMLVNWKILKELRFWGSIGAMFAVSAPMLYLSLKPFVQLSNQGSISDRSVEYASMYSASPTDFFTFASDHFLFGKWISGILDRSLWIESSLYIGLAAIILGVIFYVKNQDSERKKLGKIALVVIIAAFILALGTDLHWNAKSVIIQIPEILQPVFGKTETPIYLPAYFLFKYLPFYSKMRAIMRIGLFTLVFTSMIAGLGSAELLRNRSKPRQILMTILILGFVFVDFYPGSYARNLEKIEARPVDYWLAEQPGDGAVVQMPFSQSEDQSQLYYTLTHGKYFTGGFFNANKPPQYLYAAPILDNFPDEHSIPLLQEYQVEYIIVDSTSYENFNDIEKEILSYGLTRLTIQEDQYVYGFGD